MFSTPAIFLAALAFSFAVQRTSSSSLSLNTIIPTPTLLVSSSSHRTTPTSNSSSSSTEAPTNVSTEAPTNVSTEASVIKSNQPVTEFENKEKTCGNVTVTLAQEPTREDENVSKTIQEKLFDNSTIYGYKNITDVKLTGKKVTFGFCLVFKPEMGNIEDSAEKRFKVVFYDMVVEHFKIEFTGVRGKDWKAAEGECTKCSEGGAGAIDVKGKCEPDGHSCNGVTEVLKDKDSKDCVTYCGAVGIMVSSHLVVLMGIAMSLSFYLWE